MLIDFFASLTFYLIPYLTGRLIVKSIIQSWIIGCLVWFGIYFLAFQLLKASPFNYQFSQFIQVLVFLICTCSTTRLFLSFIKSKSYRFLKLDKVNLINFSILFLFPTLIYFFVWKIHTPYPLQLNWDVYEHITLANKIIQGNLSILPSQISDTFTFDGYTPMFHILLSLPKIIFNRQLLGIYWWLEYWHFLTVILASYFLGKTFFDNIWIARISALLSCLVFESSIVFTSLMLIPQTLTAVIVMAVVLIIKESKNIFYPGLILILLLHYIVGVAGLFIILLFWMLPRIEKFFNFRKFVVASLFLFILVCVSSLLLTINLTGREEAVHFNLSLIQKINLFYTWYGLFFPVFFTLGFVSILSKGTAVQRSVIIVSFLVFSLVFFPAAYVVKFYVLGHFLNGLILATGIYYLLAGLKIRLQVFSGGMLLILLFINFNTNQLNFKTPFYFAGVTSHLSLDEIKAATWIKANYPQDTFLLSDPATQNIFQALTELDSQGGAYANLHTREQLSANSFTYAVSKDKKQLFIVSGRYFAWQKFPPEYKNSFYYNVWKPEKIKGLDYRYLNKFSQNPHFKLAYQNDQITVFEIE